MEATTILDRDDLSVRNTRILVVDDEEVVRDIVSSFLETAGYWVESANDGYEAWEKVQNNPYHLVISDINMPGMTGLDFLEELKNLQKKPLVIILTGMKQMEIALKSLRTGAYDYVVKPFDLRDFAVTVERAVERQYLNQALEDYKHNLEKKVRKQSRTIKRLYMDSILSMASALEVKDPYTRGHSDRVAKISMAIARQMGLRRSEINEIRLGAMLHDIGKIGIRESILRKKGKLTLAERKEVEKHPSIAVEILKPIIKKKRIRQMILHHHERYDGRGYPTGIHGENIPLYARIAAVADSFDAMTSKRFYRDPMPIEAAHKEIINNQGTQFCPEVCRVFSSLEDQLADMIERREGEGCDRTNQFAA